MKLSYQSWLQGLPPKDYVLQAITKTLAEKFSLARNELRRFLSQEDGAAPLHITSRDHTLEQYPDIESESNCMKNHEKDLITVVARCMLKLD